MRTLTFVPARLLSPAQRHARRAAQVRKSNFKRRYGLLPSGLVKFKNKHRNRCGICKSTHDLCIDHDHKTNQLRGLLCRGCNRALGHFKDDIKLLRAAVAYLARSAR